MGSEMCIRDRNSLPAPTLGEHTEEILADNLKLTSVEIGVLADKGLISTTKTDS